MTAEDPFPSSLFVEQTFQFVPHPLVGAGSPRPSSRSPSGAKGAHPYTCIHVYTHQTLFSYPENPEILKILVQKNTRTHVYNHTRIHITKNLFSYPENPDQKNQKI